MRELQRSPNTRSHSVAEPLHQANSAVFNWTPSKESIQHLSRGKLLLGFDRDGTLAPITANPSESFVDQKVIDALKVLQSSGGVEIAVVSARSCSWLAQDFTDLKLILGGNYGLEVMYPDGEHYTHDTAKSAAAALQALRQPISELAATVPGVLIDDHDLSLCIHFHMVNSSLRESLRTSLNQILSTTSEVKVISLPTSFEVFPNVEWNKGMALQKISEKLAWKGDFGAFFIGDSDPDESAFEWVNSHGGLSVRIGKAERTVATMTVPSHDEVTQVIDWLVALRS